MEQASRPSYTLDAMRAKKETATSGGRLPAAGCSVCFQGAGAETSMRIWESNRFASPGRCGLLLSMKSLPGIAGAHSRIM